MQILPTHGNDIVEHLRQPADRYPVSAAQLTALTSVSLCLSRVVGLPESIDQLTSRTTLDLGDNQLAALSESTGHIPARST